MKSLREQVDIPKRENEKHNDGYIHSNRRLETHLSVRAHPHARLRQRESPVDRTTALALKRSSIYLSGEHRPVINSEANLLAENQNGPAQHNHHC